MAFTKNSTALYNDLSSYYTSFNTFIQNYGGNIAKLTVPGANSAIAASNINNLNSKINEFKSETYLKTEASLWVPAANVTAGNKIYASDWTNISTTISNFSVVKCRNTATNTYGTVACNPQSCGSQGQCNRTCSQSCQYGSNGNNSCNNNCNKACSTNGANGNNSCNNTCNKGCNPNSCSSQGTCNKTCSSQGCNPNACGSQGSCNQNCNSQSCSSNGTYTYVYGLNQSGSYVWKYVSNDDRRAVYAQNNNTSGLSSCSVTCSKTPTHQTSNRIAANACSVKCNLTCGTKSCSANGANGNSSCNNACNKGCTSNGANGNSSCNNTCSSQGCSPNACSSQGTCNKTCSSQGCNPNACSSQGTCGKTCSQSCNPYSSNSNSSCNYGTKTCTSKGTTIDIRNIKTTMTKT